MDHDQSRAILREMQASWRQEMTDDQVMIWADTLAGLEFEPARSALRNLRRTSDFLPAHHQLIEATRAEARIARLAATSPTLVPGEGLSACRCGELRGWVQVEAGEPPTLRPCPSCRPDAAERHGEGHWMPDHSCPDCARRRTPGAA